ncbi:hypothetical protein [Brevibacillus parabrevis]|uniref:hypothetical protein n=1 Tax=Brevibacillus parabrevis TaxID=54914 RepID=UPI001E3D9402|nr:hypothetical protein [Brevibacillus parabrevis]
MMKLIAIGDNVMDYYKDRGEIFPGGNALNVAVLGKRYQADVSSCIGIIGNDQAADHVRQTLASGKDGYLPLASGSRSQWRSSRAKYARVQESQRS